MGRPFDIDIPFGGRYLPKLAGKPLAQNVSIKSGRIKINTVDVLE